MVDPFAVCSVELTEPGESGHSLGRVAIAGKDKEEMNRVMVRLGCRKGDRERVAFLPFWQALMMPALMRSKEADFIKAKEAIKENQAIKIKLRQLAQRCLEARTQVLHEPPPLTDDLNDWLMEIDVCVQRVESDATKANVEYLSWFINE